MVRHKLGVVHVAVILIVSALPGLLYFGGF
mgnify:CR=1 FL=1